MNELSQHFYQLVETNRLAHAYLFTGDDYEGKQRLAKHIVQALGCLRFDEANQPCQECDICVRARNNQLADVLYLQPEGQSIKVQQIRELKEWLTTSPLEVPFKVAVIEQAETMNPSSSNALLTFLEEPARNVYLILFSQSASSVLPTIQSRVQVIHFPQATIAERLDYLLEKEIQPDHAKVLAVLSSDSTEHLIEGYDAEEMSQWFKTLNSFFQLLATRNRTAVISIETQLKPYLTVQQSLDGLDYLLALTHSGLMYKTNQDKPESILVQRFFLSELFKKHSISQSHLLALYELLLETKQRISANVSPKLALERLAILASQT